MATVEGRFKACGDWKNLIKKFPVRVDVAEKIYAWIFFIFPNLLGFLGKIT
jgi:hypothetical protein